MRLLRDRRSRSFGVNLAELGGSVGQSDVELTGTGDDVLSERVKMGALGCRVLQEKLSYLPFASRDVLGNLGTVGPVVHEQQFHVCFVSDEELSEAVGEQVTRSFGLLGTNDGHADSASEATSDRAINTSRLPPRFLQMENRSKFVLCDRQ